MSTTGSERSAFNSAWTAPAPLAVGLRSDHLIVGLPIIDDSELGDLEDRHAIQNLGRIPHNDYGGWGREDRVRLWTDGEPQDAGWVAFTTSPSNHDLAWVVRRQEDGTRSVLLYGSTAAATAAFGAFARSGELYALGRGGYHLDRYGVWRRPRPDTYVSDLHCPKEQLPRWLEDEETLPVPGARTVSVEDYLNYRTPQREGQSWIALNHPGLSFSADRLCLSCTATWDSQLSFWMDERFRSGRSQEVPLASAVMGFHSLETNGEELVDSLGMARLVHMTPNAFTTARMRAGRCIPQPYTHTASGPLWTAEVAIRWASAQNRKGRG